MLSFSSKKQLRQSIRQEIHVADEAWTKCSEIIMAKHRLQVPAAKDQLKQQSKAWISLDAFNAHTAAGNGVQSAAELSKYDA